MAIQTPVLRATPGSRSVEPLGRLAQKFGPSVPFVIAGTVKGTYDLILWRLFRTVPIPDDVGSRPRSSAHRPGWAGNSAAPSSR